MGTNFYLLNGTHLGKRSAAGHYCYKCDVSLVTGQPGGMNPAASPHAGGWASRNSCPNCGQSYQNEGGLYQPELFKPTPEETARELASGDVRGAYSFSYAVAPSMVAVYNPRRKVTSEYGDKMTLQEFRNMVERAKFRFTDSIGREFS